MFLKKFRIKPLNPANPWLAGIKPHDTVVPVENTLGRQLVQRTEIRTRCLTTMGRADFGFN